jgi:hypothetical protein
MPLWRTLSTVVPAPKVALLKIFDDQVREIARGLAQQAQHRAAALERELKAIETRKREIQTQLRTAQLVHERLGSFVPIRGATSNALVAGLNTKLPQASVRSGAAQLTLTISGAIDVSATSPCVSKD